jgi:hypothetical protein
VQKKQRVRAYFYAVLLIHVGIGGFLLVRESNRRQQAAESEVIVAESTAIVEELCRNIEQLTDRQSVDDMVNQDFEQNLLPKLDEVSSFDRWQISNIVETCAYKQKEKFPEVSIAVHGTSQKSEAESLAEGKTCSQQWRLARAETLSGTSDDSRLRATVYACKTWDDWFLGAIENSEYNDSLLAVICASEPNAPLCG